MDTGCLSLWLEQKPQIELPQLHVSPFNENRSIIQTCKTVHSFKVDYQTKALRLQFFVVANIVYGDVKQLYKSLGLNTS